MTTAYLVARVIVAQNGTAAYIPVRGFDNLVAANKACAELKDHYDEIFRAELRGIPNMTVMKVLASMGVQTIRHEIVASELHGMVETPAPKLILPS
jgi:hypothetical protein